MATEPLHKTLWQGNQALAEECLAHPFVRGLGDGTLDPEVFKHYLAQDAFFLQAFFSAYALGAVRAVERWEVVQRLHGLMRGVLDELKLHEGYAESLAIDLGNVRPHTATRAYTDFFASDRVDGRGRSDYGGDDPLHAPLCILRTGVGPRGSLPEPLSGVDRDLLER